MKKKLIFQFLCSVTFITQINAQNLELKNYEHIAKKFSSAISLNIYLHKVDTLIFATYPKRKSYPDQMGSINYYNTDGKIMYSARVGGIAGFIPDSTFKKMQSELVYIGNVILNKKAVEDEKIKEMEWNKPPVIYSPFDTTNALQKFDPNGSKIIFYTEPNFKGKQLVIDGFSRDWLHLEDYPFWNNNISSVEVPKDWSVRFYDIDEDKGDIINVGNKKYATYKIANFKSLPFYKILIWNGKNWKENKKLKKIDFDKKLSLVEFKWKEQIY